MKPVKTNHKFIFIILSVILLITCTYQPAYSAAISPNNSLKQINPPSKTALKIKNKPNQWTTVSKNVYQDVYQESIDPEIKILQQKISRLPQNRLRSFSISSTEVSSQTSSLLSQQQVKELMLSGADIPDIYWIEYLARSTGKDALKIWNEKSSSIKTWEQLEKNYDSNKSNTPTVSEEVYTDVDSTSLLNIQPKLNSNTVSMAAVSTLSNKIDSVLDDVLAVQQMNQSNKPQFADQNQNTESIDPASGSLNWNKNLVTLPGRDGLNLDLSIMYNSNQSSPY